MNSTQFKLEIKKLGLKMFEFADLMGVKRTSFYTLAESKEVSPRFAAFLDLYKKFVELEKQLQIKDQEISRLKTKIAELI